MTISAAEVLMQTECDCDTCGNLAENFQKSVKAPFRKLVDLQKKKINIQHIYTFTFYGNSSVYLVFPRLLADPEFYKAGPGLSAICVRSLNPPPSLCVTSYPNACAIS